MTRLPDPSVTVAAAFRPALTAAPPLPGAPPRPLPATVVIRSVAGLTSRTTPSAASATYRFPPLNDTPCGSMLTLVALAGPPAPPATVEMVPGAGLPAAVLASACARPAPFPASASDARASTAVTVPACALTFLLIIPAPSQP